MAIPEYYEMYNEFLNSLADGKEHKLKEIKMNIASAFSLSQQEMIRRTKNLDSTIFSDRVGWCSTYLKRAGLVERPEKAVYRITAQGLELQRSGRKIVTDTLLQFDSFKKYISGNMFHATANLAGTPEENIMTLKTQLEKELQDDLLQMILANSPDFFEKLVVDLLIKLGYSSAGGYGMVTPSQGDGGIDGVIYRDRLGLDVIYVQAKRWNPKSSFNKVGVKEVREFVGAMEVRQSKKGIFITTCDYTQEARDYVSNLPVSLVNGEQLTQLMLEYNLGVNIKSTYEIKEINQDYFEE